MLIEVEADATHSLAEHLDNYTCEFPAGVSFSQWSGKVNQLGAEPLELIFVCKEALDSLNDRFYRGKVRHKLRDQFPASQDVDQTKELCSDEPAADEMPEDPAGLVHHDHRTTHRRNLQGRAAAGYECKIGRFGS